MNHDELVRTFVLFGFLFQAIALIPWTVRNTAHQHALSTPFRTVSQAISILAFAIALVLHILGT